MLGETCEYGNDSFKMNGVISTLAEHGDKAGGFREAIYAMRGTAPRMSRGEDPRHQSVPLGGKVRGQALSGRDRGIDKGVVDRPLLGYVSSRTLYLLPYRAQGYSPLAGQALVE
jgi:hypothetical protein